MSTSADEKGVRYILPERPEGCCAQKTPDPFFIRESLAIVGLGSPNGDDQAGWIAIDRLRPHIPAGVLLQKLATPLDLIELLACREMLIVIDALQPCGAPGTVRHFRWPCPDLMNSMPLSSHGLGLVDVLLLAETIGCLPGRIDIYTIEAQEISTNERLGRIVSERMDELVDMVLHCCSSKRQVARDKPVG